MHNPQVHAEILRRTAEIDQVAKLIDTLQKELGKTNLPVLPHYKTDMVNVMTFQVEFSAKCCTELQESVVRDILRQIKDRKEHLKARTAELDAFMVTNKYTVE